MEETIEKLKMVLLDETSYCTYEDRAYIMAELMHFCDAESRQARAMATFGEPDDEEGGEL